MKKNLCAALLPIIIMLGLFYSCSTDKTKLKKESGSNYRMVIIKDTIPFGIAKNLKEGFYIFDKKNNILKYIDQVDGGPVNPVTVEREHQQFRTNHPTVTFAVNFMPSDIGDFYNDVMSAAAIDHVTVDSFRIKFLVYDTTPTINGVPRPDYVGRESVALLAISGGKEYTTTSSMFDIRPRNLGTLCPVCQ